METKLNVKLISHTMNPELVIATAGKLCYSPSDIEELMNKQTPEMVERFVNMLVSIGHESPLEHAVFNFAIEGVSRNLTHQLVRHRIASFSQQSQRYVREGQFEYVIPDDIKDNKLLTELYINHMKESQGIYDALVDGLIEDYLYKEHHNEYLNIQLRKLKIDINEFTNWKNNRVEKCENFIVKLATDYKKIYSTLEKKAIENARYVFPGAAETKIIVTMNLRTLINFCHHRCCRRAQEEINQLAWEMKLKVDEVSPLLGKCLGATCQFNKCPEGTMTCGVPYDKIK